LSRTRGEPPGVNKAITESIGAMEPAGSTRWQRQLSWFKKKYSNEKENTRF